MIFFREVPHDGTQRILLTGATAPDQFGGEASKALAPSHVWSFHPKAHTAVGIRGAVLCDAPAGIRGAVLCP